MLARRSGKALNKAAFWGVCWHSGQLRQRFRDILRIVPNMRRIGREAGLDHPVTLWIGKRALQRYARRNQGSCYIAALPLTLNQRVRGSSPPGAHQTRTEAHSVQPGGV